MNPTLNKNKSPRDQVGESSEDENISDYEEQEQKNTRKNIQQAVSQKGG